MSVPRSAVDLRALMAGFPTGVSVVTALDRGGEPWGMTCTSLISVALDPPTVLVSLRRGSPTLEAVLGSGTLAVNLLRSDAREVAELFSSGRADRFDQVAWAAAPGGAPHLSQAAHTVADCRVARPVAVGDHMLVLAEVLAIARFARPDPLMYGMRRYGVWAEQEPVLPGAVPLREAAGK